MSEMAYSKRRRRRRAARCHIGDRRTISSETAPPLSDRPRTGRGGGVSVNPAACDCAGQTQPGARRRTYTRSAPVARLRTEARRDSFRQLMPRVDPATGRMPATAGATTVPPNPYRCESVSQTTLNAEPSRNHYQVLIWTLNLRLTPIFAIGAEDRLRRLCLLAVAHSTGRRESLPDDDDDYVSRVSDAPAS